ncbi:MAG: putative sugar O-methyltransferase [Chlamydiae bacterium]|nr:putative sugar O-methyltransferase [Chlamydiota bacterium]
MVKKFAIFFSFLISLFIIALFYWKSLPSFLSLKKSHILHLSDNGLYPEFCKAAVENEKIFSHFKREPVYNLIEEYTSHEEGKSYLAFIQKDAPDFLKFKKLSRIQSNDLIGNPKTHRFEPIGTFSPSTLRYVKVASDLRKCFGSLHDFRILEIGGGYGGQCKILSDLFPLASYTLVDFKEPLELAKKYLNKMGVKNVHFLTPNEISDLENYDLVISNYSFTESTAKLQKHYLNGIFSKAKRGYLTCNFFPKHYKIKALSKERLLSLFKKMGKDIEERQEEPQTGKDNFILVWK